MSLWNRFCTFVREIIMFCLDALVLVSAREIAKRFYKRLSDRGGVVAGVDGAPEAAQITAGSGSQKQLSFLDEYKD